MAIISNDDCVYPNNDYVYPHLMTIHDLQVNHIPTPRNNPRVFAIHFPNKEAEVQHQYIHHPV